MVIWRVLGWIGVIAIAILALLFGGLAWVCAQMAAAQDDAQYGW